MNSPIGDRGRGSDAVIVLPARAENDCILTLRSRGERTLATGTRAITIDLRTMQHIDTQTLTELIIALRRLSHHHPELYIVGADPRVRWMLELCDIEGLELHPTMRSARAHLRAKQRPPRRRLMTRLTTRIDREAAA